MEDEGVVEPIVNERACTDVSPVPSSLDIGRSDQLWNVLAVVHRDLVAADLKWSMFVSASQNYKIDSCLRPFPPMFLLDGNKDFLALSDTVESIPALSKLDAHAQTLSRQAIHLLHWVLVELKEPSLSVINKSEIPSVQSLVKCEMPPPSPSLVLRVNYDMTREERWTSAKQDYSTFHAFHGSKVENFHSILHHGLQQHLTKNTLFGPGVYLSSELAVSLLYSRTGSGWRHSCVASSLSIVALCEIINHPSVQSQAEDKRRSANLLNKVYVVPNSDLLRVRYLLIYPMQLPTPHYRMGQGLLPWISRHKMVTMLVTYAILLCAIGLSRNPTFRRFWRNLWSSGDGRWKYFLFGNLDSML